MQIDIKGHDLSVLHKVLRPLTRNIISFHTCTFSHQLAISKFLLKGKRDSFQTSVSDGSSDTQSICFKEENGERTSYKNGNGIENLPQDTAYIDLIGFEGKSAEQLEEATGSKALANQIVHALKEADLPTTEANIEESAAAYVAAEDLLPLTDAAKEYMLKNEWEPTIKNLYMAAHSGVMVQKAQLFDFSTC